jgi:hypothetical protein
MAYGRDIHDFGRLIDRKTCEKAEFHDSALPRVEVRQPIKRIIQG